MTASSAIQAVLERRGMQSALAIAAVTALGWAYLLAGAGMEMPGQQAAWTVSHGAVVLAMWVVMMAAMMLPSAAPAILLHGAILRKQRASETGYGGATGAFAAGYLLVWAGFGGAATGVQWGLEQWGLLTAMMSADSTAFGGALLMVAGLYQLSPLKQACLRQCRSPLLFLAQNWREGAAGALALGLRHGTYCLGCCWALMLLLFVGGVMNLLWIAGLTLLVLLEKLAPQGRGLARITGIALLAAGAVLLIV